MVELFFYCLLIIDICILENIFVLLQRIFINIRMMDTTLPTVALVYDFDGTLAPGNMQEFGLLQALGYDNPNDFWNLCDQIAKTNDAGGIAVVMYADGQIQRGT